MTGSRLTRRELSWLLAQEARGAAKALRDGVTELRASMRPPAMSVAVNDVTPSGALPDLKVTNAPVISGAPATPDKPVEQSLSALDDAINLLDQLESAPRGNSARSRIDLASLLYEVAPAARIALEPGAGTEVFGDGNELRRMLHMLMSQATSPTTDIAQVEIRLRREDEWVKLSVLLGPEGSTSGELERRWLSRMALRHGGRFELQGRMAAVWLPADAAREQREVQELRKELEQAQQLGEAYARELATVLTAGSMPGDTEIPQAAAPDTQRLGLLVAFASALEAQVSRWFDELKHDARELGDRLGESSQLAVRARERSTSGLELVGELRRLAQCPTKEQLQAFDALEAVRTSVAASEMKAKRKEIKVFTEVAAGLELRLAPQAFDLLMRSLLDHAIAATPNGGHIRLCLAKTAAGALFEIEDGGPCVPESARADVLRHRVDPSSLGRPAGISLLVAETVSGYLGTPLSLNETANRRTLVQVVIDRA